MPAGRKGGKKKKNERLRGRVVEQADQRGEKGGEWEVCHYLRDQAKGGRKKIGLNEHERRSFSPHEERRKDHHSRKRTGIQQRPWAIQLNGAKGKGRGKGSLAQLGQSGINPVELFGAPEKEEERKSFHLFRNRKNERKNENWKKRGSQRQQSCIGEGEEFGSLFHLISGEEQNVKGVMHGSHGPAQDKVRGGTTLTFRKVEKPELRGILAKRKERSSSSSRLEGKGKCLC